LKILSDIAKAEEIAATASERKGAIEAMAKIEGWFAPTKIAETDPDGNALPNVTINGI